MISKNLTSLSKWSLSVATLGSLVTVFAPVSPIQGYESTGIVGQVLGSSRAVMDRNSLARVQAPSESRWMNFYWKTRDPDEAFINFWNLQLRSIPMDKFLSRRLVAYGLYEKDTREDLCKAISEINLYNLRVITNDTTLLGADLVCNNKKYEVVRYDTYAEKLSLTR
jgi:hypothetical protein